MRRSSSFPLNCLIASIICNASVANLLASETVSTGGAAIADGVLGGNLGDVDSVAGGAIDEATSSLEPEFVVPELVVPELVVPE